VNVLISCILKVDKHIRKLDADLARFESDLKEQHAKEAGFSDYESKITLEFKHLTELILIGYVSHGVAVSTGILQNF